MFQRFLSDVTVMYYQKYLYFLHAWPCRCAAPKDVDVSWRAWENIAEIYRLLYGRPYYDYIPTGSMMGRWTF